MPILTVLLVIPKSHKQWTGGKVGMFKAKPFEHLTVYVLYFFALKSSWTFIMAGSWLGILGGSPASSSAAASCISPNRMEHADGRSFAKAWRPHLEPLNPSKTQGFPDTLLEGVWVSRPA